MANTDMQSPGYISCLLKLYEDWHQKDTEDANGPSAGHCSTVYNHATTRRAGREALVAGGGMALLFQTTQIRVSTASLYQGGLLPAWLLIQGPKGDVCPQHLPLYRFPHPQLCNLFEGNGPSNISLANNFADCMAGAIMTP
ncbi:hypothetical protein JZ751_020751 [Albula glossodonta]|uniref:Uncharacterized protein n=1 Tax=Albula glossodonta TaxID=121402 RepID=A0A8T2PNF6_9TELE|nr:hypothetical protein JZ751_020751 [Albula glossodonta]